MRKWKTILENIARFLNNQNQTKYALGFIYYLLVFLVFIASCSTKNENVGNQEPVLDAGNDAVQSKVEAKDFLETMINSESCEFVFDTIADQKYNMHKIILDKFNNKEKRGYYFSSDGDTLNTFLYHQDIAAFVLGLEPTEQGIYKILTNKVVFLILGYEPNMLDYGLPQWPEKEKQLDYFMEHVSHPICHSVPIDSIIDRIKTEMGEPNEDLRKVKQRILIQLELGNK